MSSSSGFSSGSVSSLELEVYSTISLRDAPKLLIVLLTLVKDARGIIARTRARNAVPNYLASHDEMVEAVVYGGLTSHVRKLEYAIESSRGYGLKNLGVVWTGEYSALQTGLYTGFKP